MTPVAPIAFDNPEPVELATGTVESGNTTLQADQFGPYLAAVRDGEQLESAFYRQQVAWTAWLAAVASSTKADAVPGEAATGIGLFARTLAKGPVAYNDLPGSSSLDPDGTTRFTADAGAVNDLVVDAVPAPDAPEPGARMRVRLLNGVGPGNIPSDVIRKVVSLNGSVTVIGNGPSFDRDETTIVYSDPAKKSYAQLLKASLGAGKLRLDRTAADDVDVTVVLGRDLLGDGPQTRSNTSVTTPDSSSTTTDASSSGGDDTTTTDPDELPQGGL